MVKKIDFCPGNGRHTQRVQSEPHLSDRASPGPIHPDAGAAGTILHIIWLFSTMYHEMCPRIACYRKKHICNRSIFLDFLQCVLLNGISNNRLQWRYFCICCIFWLFSTMCHKMCPQIACYKKAYLQSEHFFDFLQCVPLNKISNVRLRECIFAFGAFFGFSPLCVIKCVLKSPATEKAYFAIGALFGFSPVCTCEWNFKSPP